MNFTVDIGNSLIKISGFEGSNMVLHKVFESSKIDEARLFFFNKLNLKNANAIISSVQNQVFIENNSIGKDVNIINFSYKTPTPLNLKYESLETLGTDRLAAAVGGSFLFLGNEVLVVNAGTCITYEFIDKDKNYLGGAISPGLMMRFKALNTFTGKLPLITQSTVKPNITGTNTVECLSSGVINGICFEIDSMIDSYCKSYPEIKIVFSGGDVFYFDKMLKSKIFATENLVSYGLNQILLYNAQKF
ncbi:MAG: type III pantothenate kinase [Bacteroidetes bacterium]|nr:type III pantothenate kinase [Bacteroidota bacterium]